MGLRLRMITFAVGEVRSRSDRRVQPPLLPSAARSGQTREDQPSLIMKNRLILKSLPALLLLSLLPVTGIAQGILATGVVTDNRGVSITGVSVCQGNSANCTATDPEGMFKLLLEPDNEMLLRVTCPGFNPASAVITDSTAFPLKITMTPMFYDFHELRGDPVEEATGRVIIRATLGLDIFTADFSAYSSLLGEHNTEALNYFALTGPEISASFPRLYTDIGIGSGYIYHKKIDTIIVDLTNTLYKFSLGYNLINSERVRLTPLVSVRLLRSRLKNFSGERKIPIEEYLQNREIDLRFRQAMAVAGVNLEYIFHSGLNAFSEQWSVGIFGGYQLKLHQYPWIRSAGNRITGGRAVRLSPFTAGISISFL